MAEKTVKITEGSSIPNQGGFDQDTITVKKGETLKWKNEDNAAHALASGKPETGPDGLFSSGLFLAKSSFVFTFPEKGTVDYFCVVHPWKTGKVTVE